MTPSCLHPSMKDFNLGFRTCFSNCCKMNKAQFNGKRDDFLKMFLCTCCISEIDIKFGSWSLLSKSVVAYLYWYMKCPVYSIMLSKKKRNRSLLSNLIVMFMLMYSTILSKKERLDKFFCVHRQNDFMESLTIVW